MQEVVLPTIERINKGDLRTYEGTRGGMQIKSDLATMYHDRLYYTNSPSLNAYQHFACERFIELHHSVFAGMGFRSVHELLLRRAEGLGSSYIERKLGREDQYFYIMAELAGFEAKVVIGLLIDGLSASEVAKAAYIGKNKVRPAFISAADKMAKQFSEIGKLNG